VTVTNDFERVEVVKLFGIPLDKLPTYRRKPIVGTEPSKKAEKINVKLLWEILEFIEAHPTTWHQQDWFKLVDRETGDVRYSSVTSEVSEQNSCGASFCFAGHVALAEGFPEPPKDDGELWTRSVIDPMWGETDEYVQDFARARLGLNSSQADVLFHESNSMKDLRNMVLVLSTVPSVDYYELSRIRGLDEDDFAKEHLRLIKAKN
jgi:hypothetical protein